MNYEGRNTMQQGRAVCPCLHHSSFIIPRSSFCSRRSCGERHFVHIRPPVRWVVPLIRKRSPEIRERSTMIRKRNTVIRKRNTMIRERNTMLFERNTMVLKAKHDDSRAKSVNFRRLCHILNNLQEWRAKKFFWEKGAEPRNCGCRSPTAAAPAAAAHSATYTSCGVCARFALELRQGADN